MNAEMPVTMFAAGLFLIYVALALIIGLVFKGGPGIPLSRRRPDTVQHSSRLSWVTAQAIGVLNRGLKKRPTGLYNRAKLEQGGLNKDPGDYLLMAGASTLSATVLAFLGGGMGLSLLAFVMTPLSFYMLLTLLIVRRRRKFDAQVPDTLQMFSGGLRAGHSLLRAIDAAAQENEAPMSEELNRVVNETRIGRDLGDSLNQVAFRTNNDDFQSIARAIDIHREVGGDLAEVLDHVGETIRDRNQVRGQVRALSAEGRVSAIVLMALPIVMFLVLVFSNELYRRVFTTTLPGYLMLGGAALFLTLGGLWLSRLVKPKY
ncbi:type II secretion system F family protein [Arthrobacter sp. P2b]|uniref:type II secretion system F family protein n=1 Tax=Arthrobacter sp. P2b TaxID=1938741 RepID=UPI0009C81A47|nr:type II secretion system F family protein [Arthrobacter sp. P2b]SLK01454.1 tight adherence protein B [Arthrobacter sp. P2b]